MPRLTKPWHSTEPCHPPICRKVAMLNFLACAILAYAPSNWPPSTGCMTLSDTLYCQMLVVRTGLHFCQFVPHDIISDTLLGNEYAVFQTFSNGDVIIHHAYGICGITLNYVRNEFDFLNCRSIIFAERKIGGIIIGRISISW